MNDGYLKKPVTEKPDKTQRNDPDIRIYTSETCATFRKTKERFGGLSNMASGFPLVVNGIPIRTSEALYQACRFPHLPDVQRLIIGERSPMAAKMKSKPHRNQTRPDWESNIGNGVVRHMIMSWCLKIKLAQNWESFGDLLLSTRDMDIVEDSARDGHWGAIPIANGRLRGVNALGRLLMSLRQILKEDPASLKSISPPDINDMILCGEPVQEIQSLPDVSPANLSVTNVPLPLPAKNLNDASTDETINNTDIQRQIDLWNDSSTPQGDELMRSGDADNPTDSSAEDDLWMCVKRLTCRIGCFKGSGDFRKILGITPKTATLWLERLETEGNVERQAKLYKVRTDLSCQRTTGFEMPVSEELANTVNNLIVNLLDDHVDRPLGAKEIAEAIGVPSNQATKWLKELKEHRKIVFQGGKYMSEKCALL